MEDVIQVHDQFYILATASRAAAAHGGPEARRHLCPLRHRRRCRRVRGGRAGAVPRGHQVPVPIPAAHEWAAAAAVERARQGRQRIVRRRPDESGYSARRRRSRARPRCRPPVPWTIPVGCDVARAASAVELQSPAGAGVAHLRHRRGLRRHLRGPRHVARAPRHALRAGDRRRDAAARLSRPGWRAPIDRSRVERGAGGRDAWHGSIRVRARTAHTDGADARDSLRSGAASGPHQGAGTRGIGGRGVARPRPRRLRDGRKLQRTLQSLASPIGRRSADAGVNDAVRRVSLCGRALVQHAVRPRRHRHRVPDAVDQPAHRARRARIPGGDAGRSRGPAAGRRTGKDPARDAQQRDGPPRRSAIRPLLRQRGRDAAVRHAGRRVLRSNRRSRVPDPAVAARRAGARLD